MSQLDLDLSRSPKPAHREDTAVFSPCGTYRYSLTRELGGERVCAFCGANPSVATAVKNDQTVSKDVGFATRWGCGRLVKVNAHAYIAQEPEDMYAAAKAGVDVIGPDNDAAIRAAVIAVRETNGLFVLASGNIIAIERVDQVLAIVREVGGVTPWCLGTNKNGTPGHELYLSYETPLVEYRR